MVNGAAPTNRLQELREAAEMSRAGIADLCGVGEHQVRRWEANEVLIPSKYLATLALRFGVSVEHLMGWDRAGAAA